MLACFVPDDARALSELSWAAFKDNDIQGAAKAARKAADRAVDRKLRAASLYNLGRALELANDRDGARAAYIESLDLRPNKIVKKRLSAIGGKAPRDALRSAILQGPFDSPEAFGDAVCSALREVDCTWFSAGDKPEPMKAPFEAATLLRNDTDCHLALQVGGTWYGLPSVSPCMNDKPGGGMADVSSIEMFRPDGAETPYLEITISEESDEEVDYDEERAYHFYDTVWSGTFKRICGVGKSGVPSCTKTIQTGDNNFKRDRSWAAEISLNDEGTHLVIEREGKKPRRYVLRFK